MTELLSALFEDDASRVLVPKKGKVIAEDGTCRIIVIRPCVSRGARILGLPPIYTPAMLEANAGVFRGWPMYADHLQEQLAEMEDLLTEAQRERILEAKKRSRSVFEIGGRIIQSWWDPSIKTEEDDERGFRQGAVVATAIPQPRIARMIETDPLVIRNSIAAYPTGAKPGRAPWDETREGALIEGIVARPPGSVDWVVRDGAGGRVLAEDDEHAPAFAVSLLEAAYDLSPAAERPEIEETMQPDFTKMNPTEIREWFAANRPDVTFGGLTSDQVTESVQRVIGEMGLISETDLETILEEQRRLVAEDLREALREYAEEAQSASTRVVEERATAIELAATASAMIDRGEHLTEEYKADLKRRWMVLPSGPTDALAAVMEGSDDKTPTELLTEAVNADVQHAVDLIKSVRPGSAVTGQGGGVIEPEAAAKVLPSVQESVLLNFIGAGTTDAETLSKRLGEIREEATS